VLTKSIGSHNPHNVVKATIAALEQLRERSAVADLRGIAIDKLDSYVRPPKQVSPVTPSPVA
jgi:ribosomal protein S5